MSNPAVKREAVLKVYPDLQRNGKTWEQISADVEDKTGVQVKPGYVKHVFAEARTGKNSKGQPTKIADLVLERTRNIKKAALDAPPLSAAELITEVLALARRAGGLQPLYDVLKVLSHSSEIKFNK
jgi:hypothetical protein